MWDSFWVFFNTGIPSEVLYLSLGLTLVVIIIGLLLTSIKDKKRFVLWTVMAEYIFIVFCSTVVYRVHMSIARWELMPFWTYRAVIDHVPRISVWDIILNVVMFMPLGFLIKLLYPKMGLGKMLLIAIACSLSIEVLQSIFSKGISQFDDVMHNTIGAALGWGLVKVLFGKKLAENHNEKIKL